MNITPEVGSLRPDVFGQRAMSLCSGAPPWTVYEHDRLDMAVLTTSMVFIEHSVEDVAGKKRLVTRRRRVAVCLS